jgi:putative ABC transport system permease protein
VSPGTDPGEVAAAIQSSVPGVVSLTSPDLFASFRQQIQTQRTGMLVALGVLLALSAGIISLVFSMVVNQRRREVGVLRALGATRARVTGSILSSAALLAVAGGIAGVVIAGIAVFSLRDSLSDVFGFPFTFPSMLSLVVTIVAGLFAAVLVVLAAAFVPAYRIGRQDPAVSMRE